MQDGMDPSVYDPKEKQSQILVENDVLDNLDTPSEWRPVSADQVRDINTRVQILEESLYEFEIYYNVQSGTSGTVTLYDEAEIRTGQYVDGQDCIVVQVDVNERPIDRPAYTSSGDVILATLGTDGNYTLSGTPKAYPVAIIHQISIPSKDVSNIPLEVILNQTFIDKNDFYSGTGCLHIPVYSESNGSITVDDVNVALFKFPGGQGKIRRFTLSGNTFNLPDNQITYIVGNYNNGNPELQAIQDREIINETTIIPILTVSKFRGHVNTVNWNSLGRAKTDLIHQSIVKTQRFRREKGINLETAPTRKVIVSEGNIWMGAVDYYLNSFDSEQHGITFVYNQNGSWMFDTVTQFNNTQYDNGTNLVTLGTNRYAVNWIFRCIDDNELVYMVLGSGNYRLVDAQASQVPDVPEEITAHSVLVGRIIVQKDATEPIEVTSAFDIQFSGGAVRSHNDLINRDATNAHPASAISFVGDYANVQLGLTEALNNRAVDLQRDVDGEDYTLMEWWNQTQSAGRLYGGEITTNGDGTVNVSAGAGIIKEGQGSPGQDCPCDPDGPQISQNKYIKWDEKNNLNLVDNAYNYIYVDGQDNSINVTTDFYAVDYYNAFTIGRAFRSGTDTIARLCGTNLWNFNRRVQLFGEERFPVERAKGLILGDAGDRRFTCSEGILWAELVNRFTVDKKESTDTFTYWYRDGSNGWNTLTAEQINNTQYDNGSGSLVNFGGGPNRFRADFVYAVHDSTYHVVFGQTDYSSLAAAETASPPSALPGVLTAYASLLGRIIIQKDTDPLIIASAFDIQFTASGVTNHNDLANRTAADAHPISAITNLQSELDGKVSTDAEMWGGANFDLS